MKRGGNYAVWLRQQYPSIIHAAVAVSAPLKAQVGFPGIRLCNHHHV